MDIRTKVLWGFLTTSFAVGTCYYGSENKAQDRVKNQMWVDHLPKSETDLFNIVAFIDQDDEDAGLGVSLNQSTWRTEQDLFLWTKDGDVLETYFPQYNVENEFTYKVFECDVKPFTLCMEFNFERPEAHGGWQNKKFYSRHDWEIETQAELEQSIKEIVSNQ